MRSLFFKLFVAFWLMMMAVVLANLAVTWGLSQYFENSERQGRILDSYATEALSAYRQGGRAGLKRWSRELFDRTELRVTLLDADGIGLLGERRWQLMRHALEDMPPPAHIPRHRSHRFRPLLWEVQDGGETFTLVILNPHELRDHLYARATLVWRIGLSVLLVGALALWLARYLTRPIRALQQASRDLAEGRLETRVPQPLGQRQDELGDLGRDFDLMAERIQSLLDGQQQLLRDVSHELRTPLARQRVALELARRKPDPAAELDRIEQEAELLDELIEEILLLVRLNGEMPAADRNEGDLAELVQRLVEKANFEQPRVQYQGPTSLRLAMDERQVSRAVENVVRNALKYSDGSVGVSLSAQPGGALIEVSDRGPGIDEAQLETIFDPFVRVDKARSRERGGWGLGLAIASRAVKLHGGRIEARNRAGGGLRLTLEIPCRAERAG